MEIACSPPAEETQGIMRVDRLFITDRSMGSCYLEIEGSVHSGSRIGWVTCITICLKYGDSLIGELKVPDMPMLLDEENNFKTDWYETKNPEMRIHDMRAFSSVFQDVMPLKDKNDEFELQRPIIAHWDVSKNGHVLTMSIDLSYLARMKTTVTSLIINRSNIIITIRITNESPFEICFESCTLILKQSQRTIGKLSGYLDIFPGTFQAQFRGEIERGTSGIATLKGDNSTSSDLEETWKGYAIKLFEADVNLDQADDGVDNDDDDDDDDDDDE